MVGVGAVFIFSHSSLFRVMLRCFCRTSATYGLLQGVIQIIFVNLTAQERCLNVDLMRPHSLSASATAVYLSFGKCRPVPATVLEFHIRSFFRYLLASPHFSNSRQNLTCVSQMWPVGSPYRCLSTWLRLPFTSSLLLALLQLELQSEIEFLAS